MRSVTISKAEKRRDVIVDLAIGLGIPLIYQVSCNYFFPKNLRVCPLFFFCSSRLHKPGSPIQYLRRDRLLAFHLAHMGRRSPLLYTSSNYRHYLWFLRYS